MEKTDRLYRNLEDYVQLDEVNPEIHFVKESEVISEDSRSAQKFIHGIRVLGIRRAPYVGHPLGGNLRGGVVTYGDPNGI